MPCSEAIDRASRTTSAGRAARRLPSTGPSLRPRDRNPRHRVRRSCGAKRSVVQRDRRSAGDPPVASASRRRSPGASREARRPQPGPARLRECLRSTVRGLPLVQVVAGHPSSLPPPGLRTRREREQGIGDGIWIPWAVADERFEELTDDFVQRPADRTRANGRTADQIRVEDEGDGGRLLHGSSVARRSWLGIPASASTTVAEADLAPRPHRPRTTSGSLLPRTASRPGRTIRRRAMPTTPGFTASVRDHPPALLLRCASAVIGPPGERERGGEPPGRAFGWCSPRGEDGA